MHSGADSSVVQKTIGAGLIDHWSVSQMLQLASWCDSHHRVHFTPVLEHRTVSHNLPLQIDESVEMYIFFLNTWKSSSPCWLNSESQVLFEYSDIVVVISTVSTNPLMFFNTIFSTNSLSASLYKSLHHWKICNSLKQGYTAQVVIVPLINRASFSPPNMSGLFQLPLPSL